MLKVETIPIDFTCFSSEYMWSFAKFERVIWRKWLAWPGRQNSVKLVRIKPTWMWSHLATLLHDKILSLHQSICANIPVQGPKCVVCYLPVLV